MIARALSKMKDPVSGLTHLLSAFAAVVGMLLLYSKANESPTHKWAAIVYGVSLVLLFSASAVYHLVRTTPSRERLLRKIDHSAIYLFIAGTYTPVCALVLSGTVQKVMLLSVWALAFLGVFFKIVSFHSSRWLSIFLYLSMGWIAVFAFKPLMAALPPAGMMWLVTGGVLYTLGALVYATKKLDFFPGIFGFHEVWHLFVTAASVAHFLCIFLYVFP